MKKHTTLLGISLLALAVSGCAVTTQPIDRSVSEQRARDDLQAMFKDQEPLSGPLTLHEATASKVTLTAKAAAPSAI